ncbi:diguanylate cyclase (GGDEF)-like protein [Albidovulum inexpectatum]|uniref:Diguanylate cyclase (GGDEF)-like protein n=1 Tax=Albidovulum inexpectatum TaxID=196587 RepID=A0A2S5JFP9_9RHOB|nr:GGDEF domain-containing protein [Albidovulum inexpectatum]PPB80221.1 diguanylate cyclase (GGDEF)-like protein [Albidovulum inexpectatum]
MDTMVGGTIGIDPTALGVLMPMHIVISAEGEIASVGTTIARLRLGRPLLHSQFRERFELRKPHTSISLGDLRRLTGQRLHLRLRESPFTAFRGTCVELATGQGLLFNLSFGIGLAEAVRSHGLTAADFAPTDLAIEFLYLKEAKAAVMSEIVALNGRLRVARQRAEAQALTDPLTGLHNRRALDMELQRSVAGVLRGGPGFALMQIDLDFFKVVNDTKGHAAGDHVLTVAAERLRKVFRSQDFIARVGGDEFVILLPGLTEPADLRRVARRLIRNIEQPIEWQGEACRISGSIGITMSSLYASPDPDRMLSDADAALYEAKRSGRGCYRVHSEKTAASART